jgi:putative hydrolase of the HAD superfamily
LHSTERMPAPKAVIFDFFGTLVPCLSLSEHKAVLGRMAVLMGAPHEAFVQQWFDTVKPRMTGQFPSVRANIEAICATLSVPFDAANCERAVKERYAYTRATTAPRRNAIEMLRELRARGLKIGLISDCSRELPDVWPETEFAPWFDVTVFSVVAKIKKPNPEIYHLAADKLGVPCSECLYVGDGGSNELTGAKAVGMQPVLLYEEDEQGNADTHRVDGQAWDGAQITDLSEITDLISMKALPSR